MDTGLLALIGIGIVALIIGMNAFKFWARRKLRSANQKRAITDVQAKLVEFGRSVILEADAPTVATLIEAVPKNKLTKPREGIWGFKYVDADDVVIEIRDTDGGSELLVTSMREYWDSPQELPKWTNLTEQLVRAAQAAGISTRRGAHRFQFQAASQGTRGHGQWVLV
jgi:hypothetical protein